MFDAASTKQQDYEDTPQGNYARWMVEIEAARKSVKKWHEVGAKIVDRFRDKRDGEHAGDARWNLFTANIQTQEAMLYGKTPEVSVERRFDDSKDVAARVASEMLERLLNTDIIRDSDGFSSALQHSLADFLKPGMGSARVRYVASFETLPGKGAMVDPVSGAELAPAVPEQEQKSHEDVETDYVFWKDQLWSPARTAQDLRWWAFRAQMSREDLVERFKDMGKLVPLNSKKTADSSDAQKRDPWSRADVWEVWSKEDGKVYWLVEGFDRVLDVQEDPLGLEGFWPFPEPMMANLTTDDFIPTPDFKIAQDLYDEVDELSERIRQLQAAVKVRGVYDEASKEIGNLLNEAGGNMLIPVSNWAAFGEKGGLAGSVAWMPLEQVVAAMDKLREVRSETIGALYQITGMSDIMRGQSDQAGVTATEQSIKARFASVRLQARQDRFAKFASDIQKLRAELICKHFDGETIVIRSNATQLHDDPAVIQQAVRLLKEGFPNYRVEVKPEAVSMTDFAALKSERMEVLGAVGEFIQVMGPLAQQMPGSATFMLQLLQWLISGIKGSSQAEAILDQAIAAANQAQAQASANPQPQQPDPRLMTAQFKAQADLAKIKAQQDTDLVRINAETQAIAQRRAIDSEFKQREDAHRQDTKAGLDALSAAFSPAPVVGMP